MHTVWGWVCAGLWAWVGEGGGADQWPSFGKLRFRRVVACPPQVQGRSHACRFCLPIGHPCLEFCGFFFFY